MLYQGSLRELADGLAGDDLLAWAHQRLKGPPARRVQRFHLFAAPNPRPAAGLNPRQRPLNAVIDAAHQPRPEPHGAGRPCVGAGRRA